MRDTGAEPGSTLGEALQNAVDILTRAGLDSATREAELLLAGVLNRARTYGRAFPERTLSIEQQQRFQHWVGQRAGGTPLAYLLGEREFWSLPIQVTVDTLIPRPETELLVELALRLAPARRACRVADLGTGSGAIAVALARERSGWHILATDRLTRTLAVARRNRDNLGVGNVALVAGDWCAPLGSRQFDLIISNPPYIAEGDPCLRLDGVSREPRTALIAGPDGLDAIRRLTAECGRCLSPGGWLLLEHGSDQGEPVRSLLHRHGWCEVAQYEDLAGLPRATSARRF